MKKQCEIPLGELGEMSVGHQLRKAVEPNPAGDHLLIQLRNAQEGSLDLSDASRMTLDAQKVRRTVQRDDILLRSRGANYGAALVNYAPDNSVPIAPLFLFRLSHNAPVSPNYLVWFLNCETTQSALKSCERGTYTPSVSVEDFKKLTIVVPPSDTQAHVVEADALARQARDITQKIQALRDKQTSAILEKTVFGTR